MKLEPKKFTGVIQVDDDTYPAAFEIKADDGRIQVDMEPIPTKAALALNDGQPGMPVREFLLSGSNDSGETFLSDTVSVDRVQIGMPNSLIGVSTREAKVAGVLESPAPAPVMRLWLRGFKSSLNAPVETALGFVEVRGSSKVVDADDMSGFVAVRAQEDTDLDGWAEKADALLAFMHRGLAFARGGRLQAPGLELYMDDRWEATYYAGKGSRSSFAPIHHLNQGPFIETLAKRFDAPEPFPDMLWTAIGMMNTDTSFNEVRLLMSMTALDAIVEHVIPKTMTTVMPKGDYVGVRDKLLAVLSDMKFKDESHSDIFAAKIKQLNGRTLSQKVQALRDHYGLSKDVYTDEAIAEATKRRNAIAHPSESSTKEDLWPRILFVRELVSQIVFHEIGYAGPYESYAGGYKTVYPK
ncbi:hypothetical protein [Pseudoxanthomonas mexicana]